MTSFRMHAGEFGRGSRFLRCFVNPCLHLRGEHKVGPQVRNVFEEENLVSQRDPVEQHKMLMNLSHISDMGNNRQVELPGKQAYGKKLTHTGEAGDVRLDIVDGTRLKKVLEHNPVGDVFAGSKSYRRNLTGQFDMAQQIVGVCGLLNPQWLEKRELPDHAGGGGQVPLLVGV